ncbi:YdcF family protein [Aphanothece hegewaldii CCALA 016]|uniref:YdcF family protein n=1 Tax=Aphanothece hegewaldii CCALA 016 TaxID=2107694 RepID=A0A2T1LWB5_9CHRO|nr:YdcF family protein [Aphanothece hegewaldii]PSF36190.1 YdcF family protein [Aphanothece hegewaldii CCALA 016]
MILRLSPIRKKKPSRSIARSGFHQLWLMVGLTFTTGVWWGYREVKSFFTPPEAILVLGGHESRERYAAKLALKYPNLPIWVSSGSPKAYAKRIFTSSGVNTNPEHLHLDYRAVDTVTNFTTLVEDFKKHGIDSVYLVTSDNHMRRARIVGEIVLGSQGIFIRPLSVPSDAPSEPIEKSLRDGARAVLWLIMGSTGEDLKKYPTPR